jgi:hypothetical protein
MATVSVVYQLGKGHTKVLAEAILRGVQTFEGSGGRILEIRGQDIDTAERLGNRVGLITRRLKDGTPFETIRFKETEFRQQNARRKEVLSDLKA